MSARSKENHAIQVFPFLAVLVCTMGALIFLLVVMTLQVRKRENALVAQHKAQRVIARAEAKRARKQKAIEDEQARQEKKEVQTIVVPALPVTEVPKKPVKFPDQSYQLALEERERELDALTIKWKLKTEKLQEERDKSKNSLLRNKRLINAALAHANQVKSEVEILEGELEQTSAQMESLPTIAAQEAEQLVIEQQIAQMKKRLRAAQRAESNGANDQFQVVPFDPQSGTTRHPILIECTQEGLRFLPEDITISSADLKGFTSRVNPLAAGTGALINYWNEQNAKHRHSNREPEPYPLLLVRPDGVVAYYVAMKMLEPIRAAHGYELIEDSTKLKLPEADPNAKAACQAAVERMLGERENVLRAAMNSGNGGSVYGGIPHRVSSRGGGGTGKRGDVGSDSDGNGPGGGGGGKAQGRNESGGFTDGGAQNEFAGGQDTNRVGKGNAIAGKRSGDAGSVESSMIDGNETLAGRGNRRRSGDSGFTLSALDNEDDHIGNRSWERIENFEGRPAQRSGNEVAADQTGSPFSGGSSKGQGKKRRNSSAGSASSGLGTAMSGDPDAIGGAETRPATPGSNVFGLSQTDGNSSGASSPALEAAAANSSSGIPGSLNSIDANSAGGIPSDSVSSDVGPKRSDSSGAPAFGGAGRNSGAGVASNATGPAANNSGGAGGSVEGGSSADGTNVSGYGNAPVGSNSGGRQAIDRGSVKGDGSANGGEAANGAGSANAGATTTNGGAPNSSGRNGDRWTSPGVKQNTSAPTDESGNVGNSGGSTQGQPGMPIGRRPGSKGATGNQGTGNAAGGSDSGDNSAGQTEVAPLFGTPSITDRYGYSDDDSAPQQRKKRGPLLSSNSSRPSGKRSKSSNDSEKPFEPEMLAGRHWGYADAGASIGFERDVRVFVAADKLLIAERYEIPVMEGDSKQDTFELFVTLLDRHAHEWGRPPQGFFWTPRLKFVVKPEGTILYEQVNTMMTRAGLSTSHEFAKSKETIEYGRDSISDKNKKPGTKSTRKYGSGGNQ